MTLNNFGQLPDGPIPDFSRVIGNKALLRSDFHYIDKDGEMHTAMSGLVYDGASIPKPLWGLSTNPWADDVIAAATIHDWYCKLGREGLSPYPSSHVHRLFYEVLRCIGVPEWRARARYLSVYNFGPRFKAAATS